MKTKRRVMRAAAPWAFSMVALLTCLTFADTLSVPHTFVSGTSALASEVNANFQAIEDLVNGRLDGANLEADSVSSLHLMPNSVGANEIDTGVVGSSELAETVEFGVNGAGGFVAVRNPKGSDKVQLGTGGCSGNDGGAIWVYQRSDSQIAAYVGVAACPAPDGGLVSVSNASGATAVQLQGSGDVYKTGNNGFVHPHPADPTQQIVYMSLEGPERGTYFRGTADLIGGAAVIVPPEDWRWVTSLVGITVQVTARGDCNGLFVADVDRDRIVVRELAGGTSDVEFDYLVQGKRAGFEDHRAIEANTMFLPTKDRWEGELDRGNAPALIANGILLPDGTVNRALVDAVRALNRDSILEPDVVPPARTDSATR